MPIAGLAVLVKPDQTDSVRETLSQMECVEVYGADDKGNLIVVLDCSSTEQMREVEKQLRQVDGVVNVAGAYYNFEDILDAPDEFESKRGQSALLEANS
ncbi:MAG: chaperone NapD [Calditrichaeota bacterium]|nr:chaperone NapD [Calditrichota bacterium]